MYVNFFDTVITADSPVAILDMCRLARPDLADDLSIVQRNAPEGPDVYRMRGATHTGYAVFDGESYAHVYTDGVAADPLHGFSPDEIVVGPGGQTLAQAAADQDCPTDADEAATHERDAANYRADDADRMARGLEPIHPYAWDEVEMAPGWEDRCVERAKREGLLP
jgi:hypothetical protein